MEPNKQDIAADLRNESWEWSWSWSRGAVLVLFVLLLAHAGISVAPLHAASSRPNVVIFLADDAGWGDFSHSGNPQVSTPNIDTIASEGVSLEHFYVSPVCSPTRAEFLTGRYHPRGGVRGVSTGWERLNLEEKTVADAFQAAGYATGAFGKWHNGSQWPYHPMARGFDEYFGHTSGHWGEYFDAPLEENGGMIRTRGYIVDVCTDRALDFIER
ncbi:MAG TPA: sulfatase-like hydrolase/transferase, partial [Methylomirabilota bacterium]|nr:sulfatase-like hydrolase/transferase [Methylomirabilota bacterium]